MTAPDEQRRRISDERVDVLIDDGLYGLAMLSIVLEAREDSPRKWREAVEAAQEEVESLALDLRAARTELAALREHAETAERSEWSAEQVRIAIESRERRINKEIAARERAESSLRECREALNKAGKKISGAALHQMHPHAEMEVREGLRTMARAIEAADRALSVAPTPETRKCPPGEIDPDDLPGFGDLEDEPSGGPA